MKDLDKPLLRHDQITELKGEKERLEGMLADPFTRSKIKAGEARRTLAGINKSLTEQCSEPLTGPEKDKLAGMEKDLRSTITENMPTQEEMRKNPPGAVDHHRKWEAANKRLIMRWKNVRRQLNHGSDETDVANLERYRPAGAANRLRTDAQIQGHMSYGNVPERNWEMAFGSTEQATAPIVAKEPRKRGWTPGQKEAARERLAKARAIKAEKLAAANQE